MPICGTDGSQPPLDTLGVRLMSDGFHRTSPKCHAKSVKLTEWETTEPTPLPIRRQNPWAPPRDRGNTILTVWTCAGTCNRH
eukprot:12838174-Heterocapsa_arctica.AAC.1